jgi:hypothetical protein
VWFHEHQAAHPILEYGEVADLLRWTPERLHDRLLAAWDALARQDDGTVRIVEGSFFQIPVGLMLAMNVPPARIRALLRRIDALIASRASALVYLHRPDLRRAFHDIGRERGEPWLEEIIAVLAESPYGRRHRVRDVNGLIEYYRRQRAIVDAAFARLTLRRIAIDVSRGRWPQYARRMSAFLGIRHAAPDELGPAALLRHVGQYRGRTTGSTSVVTTDARALYLQQPASSALPLLRVGPGHYCVGSLPIDVRFSYDTGGSARRFAYESRMVNETIADRLWIRA